MAVVNRVRNYLGRANYAADKFNQKGASDPDTTVEAGDFRVNVTARRAQLRGKDLQLTSAEFDVLLYLMNHPRRLVTAQTRLATNWASTVVHQTEFLPALVSLRKKLEAVDAAHCYIRTEPWVFYRFYPMSTAHEPLLNAQPDDAEVAHK